MNIKQIDASMVRRAFLAAANELEAQKEWINELNVFPVPDGDTGTNMTLTIMTAAREVADLEDPDMHALCKAISSGSLRGARGNSGVILSQLLRGLTKELDTSGEIGVRRIASAMERATETAYKAVMKPKEGTILTVARAMSEKASELAETETDIILFAEAVIRAGDEMLQKTPDLLPVLKQAGVVDSGGQGLMVVIKGALKGITGESGDVTLKESSPSTQGGSRVTVDTSALDTSDIKFGYCTEFIILLESPLPEEEETKFKAFLESIGDSIVCVASDEFVKVHVHTNDPGLAIQKGLSYGQLSRMKIDNMREEHNERLIKDASRIAAEEKKKKEAEKAVSTERKEYGFISVSAGSGLSTIFSEIGVDMVIEGGQTMNPSTEDILNAIGKVNADTVYVLPNNSNIILAASQAAELTEGKKVVVVPTKNIPQGITAMVSFMPESSPEENLEAMTDACHALKTAEITYAVRDTHIDGFEIHEGDIMAIGDYGMLTIGKTVAQTVLDAIGEISSDDTELITLYYGENISAEEAGEVQEAVREKFPDAEVELNYGGQPVYYYFISAE